MYPASATFQSTVRDSAAWTRTIKVEQVSAADLTTVLATMTPNVTGGTVNVSQHRETRRSLTGLMIANPGGVYTPQSSADPFWVNNVIRIWDGIVYPGGATEYVPLGVFRINRPFPTQAAGEHLLRVDAVDLWKQLQYTGLTEPLRFAKGSSVASIFRGLAAAAGLPLVSIDPSLEVMLTRADAAASDITLPSGTKVADGAAFLSGAFGVNAFFDPLGVFICKPQVIYGEQATVWDFSDAHQGVTRADGGYEDTPDLANHIGVRGTSMDIGPVYGQASDQNSSSPTYIGGSFGDRYIEYRMGAIQSSGQATQAAVLLLQRRLLPSHPVTFQHAPYAFLDGEDVVTATSSELKLSKLKCMVDSMTISLAQATATTKLYEVRSLQ